MLCENCPARVTGGCFISKGKHVRCDREEKEIKKARDVLILTRELDELATRYIVDKDKEAGEKWYNKLKEVGKW